MKKSVIAYFNQHYVSTNIFSKELGKKISKAIYYREQSDYVDFYVVSKKESQEQIETARIIIESVENYINNFKS